MDNDENDRRQKHVSFDSSSLMRSQTLAAMDEASFQRMAAAAVAQQNLASSPSKSSERLIDGRKTPDFEFYSQIFPPELARQIMMGKNIDPSTVKPNFKKCLFHILQFFKFRAIFFPLCAAANRIKCISSCQT